MVQSSQSDYWYHCKQGLPDHHPVSMWFCLHTMFGVFIIQKLYILVFSWVNPVVIYRMGPLWPSSICWLSFTPWTSSLSLLEITLKSPATEGYRLTAPSQPEPRRHADAPLQWGTFLGLKLDHLISHGCLLQRWQILCIYVSMYLCICVSIYLCMYVGR